MMKKKVAVVAALVVVLAFSASVMWVACGEGVGTLPTPALDATETATSSSPSVVTTDGVDGNDHRAALIRAAAERAEQQLEVATASWIEMGVSRDEVDRRASDVRAYIDQARRNGPSQAECRTSGSQHAALPRSHPASDRAGQDFSRPRNRSNRSVRGLLGQEGVPLMIELNSNLYRRVALLLVALVMTLFIIAPLASAGYSECIDDAYYALLDCLEAGHDHDACFDIWYWDEELCDRMWGGWIP